MTDSVTLHNADWFDIFPTIADGSVNLVCEDIPYGTTQCRWDSVLDYSLMREQFYRIASLSRRRQLPCFQPSR